MDGMMKQILVMEFWLTKVTQQMGDCSWRRTENLEQTDEKNHMKNKTRGENKEGEGKRKKSFICRKTSKVCRVKGSTTPMKCGHVNSAKERSDCLLWSPSGSEEKNVVFLDYRIIYVEKDIGGPYSNLHLFKSKQGQTWFQRVFF